jgi:hypothetical protein
MRCRLLPLLAFVMTPFSCVAVAYPPAPPADPVEVFLLRQGAHTGVVLPVVGGQEGEWVEYAFGNWGWYGEGNRSAAYGVYALAVPNRSALGRRIATVHPQQDALLSERGASLQGFAAERALVAALQAELNEEFSAAGVEPREAGLSGLLVVPARQEYALNYNCSDATINWMRRLGCSVPIGGIVRSIELRQTGP